MRALRTVVLVLVALAAGTVLWLDLTDLSRSGGAAPVVMPAQPAPPAKTEAPAMPPAGARPPAKHAVAAPDPALIEQGPYGPLPRIAADGRHPSKVYAAPAEAKTDKPRVAAIVTELGLARVATDAAIDKLPGAVSLGFSPYANELEAQTARARAAGHEVLLAVPMEPIGYPSNDPGNRALLTAFPAAENIAQLKWLMARFRGYVGVIPSFGSRFLASSGHLSPILNELNARGLMFVDFSPTHDSAAPQIAGQIKLPLAEVTQRIDEEPAPDAIDAALAKIEEAARRDGSAIAVGLPYPVTIERLAVWLAGLAGKGIAVVPVSALAK
jgi:polysaccharide deacetylase 2 family uncharacterized protein YibQ